MARQLKKGIRRTIELVEEENKIFNLFSKQISREVAREVLDKDGKLPSEVRFVSVIFIDIRNFTGFAESKSAEELVMFQNTFFSVIIEAANKFDGIVNQFLGDGAMISFGAPLNSGNAAAHAIRSAMEMSSKIDEAIKAGIIPEIKFGIGIHAGNAVCGNIGTTTKSEYSITGSVVILAARIEDYNKQLRSRILVSQEAYDHAGLKEYPFENMGQASLKGWSSPVVIYKLA